MKPKPHFLQLLCPLPLCFSALKEDALVGFVMRIIVRSRSRARAFHQGTGSFNEKNMKLISTYVTKIEITPPMHAEISTGWKWMSPNRGLGGEAWGNERWAAGRENRAAGRFSSGNETNRWRTGRFCRRAGRGRRGTERVCAGAEEVCRSAARVCDGAEGICRSAATVCDSAEGFCRSAVRVCDSAEWFCRSAEGVCDGADRGCDTAAGFCCRADLGCVRTERVCARDVRSCPTDGMQYFKTGGHHGNLG